MDRSAGLPGMRSESGAGTTQASGVTRDGWFELPPRQRGAPVMQGPPGPGAAFSLGKPPWSSTAQEQPTWFEDLSSPHGSAAPPATATGRALFRLFRTYVAARAVVGVLLAVLHAGSAVTGTPPQAAALWVTGLYALQVLATAVWQLRRFPVWPVKPPGGFLILMTVGADALTFLWLLALESGASFNFAALLVLPVLMAGVLMPRRLALATAAAVTLALLFQAWWNSLQIPAGPSPWLTAGLVGTGLFGIAWLSGELASRLLREELAAADSQERARQQARLNRLVIEEMGEGVLVLNRQCRVLAANPAAQALLGLSPSVVDAEVSALNDWPWAPVVEAVERAHQQSSGPAAGQELAWLAQGQNARNVRVRVRFTRSDPEPGSTGQAGKLQDLCVLLLEDERTVQARVQREKLAAMGRVSAGIAHEIRNPLSAIAQANQLLAEEPLARPQSQLVAIIGDNVLRLRRLVDDVLEALPAAHVQARPVDAVALLRSVVSDWARTAHVAPEILQLQLPAQEVLVLFDPEHLRRVLVNLLENAVRHSTVQPDAVRIWLDSTADNEVMLVISNDGLPVPPEVEIHMFEPFFSTRSRGSGLGLYICKELCERHHAGIRLLHLPPPERHRTAFQIRLQRALMPPVNRGLV